MIVSKVYSRRYVQIGLVLMPPFSLLMMISSFPSSRPRLSALARLGYHLHAWRRAGVVSAPRRDISLTYILPSLFGRRRTRVAPALALMSDVCDLLYAIFSIFRALHAYAAGFTLSEGCTGAEVE